MSEIFKLKDFVPNLTGETLRSQEKIYVEYDGLSDTFSLRVNSTSEITPEEASTLVSLLMEGQRIRGEYFKHRKNGA